MTKTNFYQSQNRYRYMFSVWNNQKFIVWEGVKLKRGTLFISPGRCDRSTKDNGKRDQLLLHFWLQLFCGSLDYALHWCSGNK